MLGKFVTAKLFKEKDCRQGWVIRENLFLIQGLSGEEYICEGLPIVVMNPPEQTSSKKLEKGK